MMSTEVIQKRHIWKRPQCKQRQHQESQSRAAIEHNQREFGSGSATSDEGYVSLFDIYMADINDNVQASTCD